jgi:oxygen-dependent protoporphyrinogen oxidase
MDAPHVIVIGGGLAGLAAASRLLERGHRVTLVEREAEAGGRVARGAAAGDVLDPRAPGLTALARAAGALDALLPLRPVRTLRVRGGALAPLAPFDREGAPRLLDRLRLARLERVEGRFRGLLAREASERAERLDDRSIEELARLYLPRAALAGWIAPLAAAWGLGEPGAASRVALMRLHAAGALGAALPRVPLGALAGALAARVGARLACEARAVEPAGGGLRVALADGSALEADAAILAVPARAALALAAPLLTPPERGLLAEARSAPALVLQCELEEPLRPEPTWVAVDPGAGLPLASVLLDPGPPAGARLLACAAWSAAHLGAPDDAIAKELAAALDRLLPGASGRVAASRVHRFPEAWPLFPVGRYRALSRLRRIQEDRRAQGRRLYLAGDHLAGPTAEDAARSGLRAATDCTSDLRGR